MHARIRISVPDRPGSLGAVTTAVGATGADIDQVEVLAVESTRATDDLRLRVDDAAHADRVGAALSALPGVNVLALVTSPAAAGAQADLELVRTVMANPGPQVLADQASGALDLDWAAVCEVTGPASSRVVATSARGPAVGTVVEHPIRLGTMPARDDVHRLVVPLRDADSMLLLGRSGLDFHRQEVYRFGELGRVLGALM